MFKILWFVIACSLDIATCTIPDDESCLLQTRTSLHSHRHLNESAQAQELESLESLEDDKTKLGWIMGTSAEQMNNYSHIPSFILLDVESFESNYTWGKVGAAKKSNGSFHIKGVRPKRNGQLTSNIKGYPVYLHLTGSFDTFAAREDMDYVEYMAARGFVSAAVEYDNGRFCPDLCRDSGKCNYKYPKYKHHKLHDTKLFGSMTLFDKASRIKHALDVLCKMPSSDCSKGVAVSGFSQGAFIANAWALKDHRISALLLMGIGVMREYEEIPHAPGLKLVTFNQSCLEDASLSKHVPRTRRRYIDGSGDALIGAYHKALQQYSGYHCENKTFPINCIQPDGSGYYIVSPKQYEPADIKLEHKVLEDHKAKQGVVKKHNVADHNFFGDMRPIKRTGELLPSFENGHEPWCMHPSLDWLAATSRQDRVSVLHHSAARAMATIAIAIVLVIRALFHV